MAPFDELDTSQRTRIFSFIGIAVYLLLTNLFTFRTFSQIPYTDNINFDGADFTIIANFFVFCFRAILYVGNFILSVGQALVILIIWKKCVFKAPTEVDKVECVIATYTLIGFAVLSVVIGFLILGVSGLVIIFITPGIHLLLLWLLGANKLHEYYWNQENNTDEA